MCVYNMCTAIAPTPKGSKFTEYSLPLQSPGGPPLWVLLADYQATESGMLSVSEGELVEVIDTSRNEWCLVRTASRDMLEGWVPAAYLKPYDMGGYCECMSVCLYACRVSVCLSVCAYMYTTVFLAVDITEHIPEKYFLQSHV